MFTCMLNSLLEKIVTHGQNFLAHEQLYTPNGTNFLLLSPDQLKFLEYLWVEPYWEFVVQNRK